MTIFDTKLKQVMSKNVDKATIAQLDALQEAFKRLGPKSQAANLKDLRDAATGNNGLGDLADLLQNVAKPATASTASTGSKPATRPSADNSYYL